MTIPDSRFIRVRALNSFSALLFLALVTSCGGSTDSPDDSDTPASEAVQIPTGPIQAIEHVEATSKDGVLFDLKLKLPVFDHNSAGGRRDDAEVITPDKTEYQGIFADGPGTLLIVSCFADICQTDLKTATFEVHYWIETVPDPLPDGVSLLSQ